MDWFVQLQKVDWKALLIAGTGKLAGAVVILVVGMLVAKWVANGIERALERARVEKTAARFLRRIAHALLLVIILLTVLNILGVPMTSALALLGAAGLAIGLALKDSLSNIASGVMLVTLRPFKEGDVVTVDGLTGTVESLSIFVTRLRGGDNQVYVLPNSLITGTSVTNLTPDMRRRVELVVGIGYDDDIDRARAIALDLMHADKRVLRDPAPDVLVYALGDNAVNLGIRCHVGNADFGGVKFGLLEAIKKAFDAAGISFPYPQREVHLRHVANAADAVGTQPKNQ